MRANYDEGERPYIPKEWRSPDSKLPYTNEAGKTVTEPGRAHWLDKILNKMSRAGQMIRGSNDEPTRADLSHAYKQKEEFDRLQTLDRERELFSARAVQLAKAFIPYGDIEPQERRGTGVATLERGTDPLHDHVARLETLLLHRKEIALFLESLLRIYGGMDPIDMQVSQDDIELILQGRMEIEEQAGSIIDWESSLDEDVRDAKVMMMHDATEHIIDLVEDLHDYGTILIRSGEKTFTPSDEVTGPNELEITISNVFIILTAITDRIDAYLDDPMPHPTLEPTLKLFGTSIRFESDEQFRGFITALTYLLSEFVFISEWLEQTRSSKKDHPSTSDAT